jgi:hypothetical protein
MMNRHRDYALVAIWAALLIVAAVGSANAQLLTVEAPQRKVVDTFHILTSLLNLEETTVNIPDDQDLIVTDAVATCRTLNACALNMRGPSQNASFDLLYLEVPANSTVSHAFNTGLRVPGGVGAKLFIHSLIQPGPPALLSVTLTGYFVRK